jgi:hypothetical protein
VDGTSNASIKPSEIEGNSIEKDITAYVADYKFSSTLDALSSEATLEFNNPDGILTPDNTKSALNWTVLNGINTFAPLLVKGAEIQIYRISDTAYLDPSYRTDPTKWKPRFRGEIKTIKFGTQAGQDQLQIVIGDALYRANKATLTGSFSPIMRSSSQCPPNIFYTLTTLQSAVASHFRDLVPSGVMDPNGHFTPTSFNDKGGTNGEMPDYLLARLLWWDRDDIWKQLGKSFAPFCFTNTTYEDESKDPANVWITPSTSNATAVWTLNGNAWFVESGTVTADATTGNIFEDPTGSMKLVNANIRHTVQKLPGNLPSRLTFGYKLGDEVSTITVKLLKQKYNRSTLAYVGSPTTVYSTTLQGVTTFDANLLGGTSLNAPGDVAYTWKRANLDPLPNIDPSTWDADVEAGTVTLFELRFAVAGTAWIDLPRWEFISVDKNADNTSYIRDNNIMNYPCRERWVTTDGVTYTDPYTAHRTLSKKNVQVVMRSLMSPYYAGTEFGFGPANLRNRSLPETFLYEKELVEGQDFEILFDKGAIQLSYKYPQVEIFVRHTEYDLPASGHMEASAMLKHLMVNGMGHDANKIKLENTGIILSRISLDSSTSTSIAKAINDIRGQIPQNYYIYADGDANIIGKFIQQSGSPRILNPIKQAAVPQISGGVLTAGSEYWYTVTSLMADGKETLPSNLMATVDYFNYFDATHKSTVEGGYCPALCITPVPNQVGFVIRRAKAYKTAASMVVNAAPFPKVKWNFDGADWKAPVVGTAPYFAGTLTSAIITTPVEIAVTGGRQGGLTTSPMNLRKASDVSNQNAQGHYTMLQDSPVIGTSDDTGEPGEIEFQSFPVPTDSVIKPTTDTRTKYMTTTVDLRDSGAETGKVAIRFEMELPKTAIHPEVASGFEILRLGTENASGTITVQYVPRQGGTGMPHEIVVSVYGDIPERSVTLRPKIAGVLMEVYVEYDGMTLTASAGGSTDQFLGSTVIPPPTYGVSGTPLLFGSDAAGTAYDTLEIYTTTVAVNALSSFTQFPYFTWDQNDSGVIALIPTDPTQVSTVLANRSWYTFIDRGYTAGVQDAQIDLTTADSIQSATLYINEQSVPLGFDGGTLSQFITWITTTNSGVISFPFDGKNETFQVTLVSGNILKFTHKRGAQVGQMSFAVRMTGLTPSAAAVSGTNWNRTFAILGKIPQQYLLPHTGQINEGISILGSTVTLSNLKGIQLEQKDDNYRTVGKVIGSVKNRPGSTAALVPIEPINFFGSIKAPFPAKSLIYGYPETLSSELPSTKYYQYAVVWERFLMATASSTIGNQPMRRAPHNRSRQGDHIAAFSLDVPPGTTLRGFSINFVSAPIALEGNAAGGVDNSGMSALLLNTASNLGINGMIYDWGFGTPRFPQMLSGSGDYNVLFYPLIALDDDGTIWQPIPSIGVDAVKVTGANLWHTVAFKQVDYDTLIHTNTGGRLLDGSRRVHIKLVLAAELSSLTFQGLSYRIDSQPKK